MNQTPTKTKVGLINQAPTTNNNHGGIDKSSPCKNHVWI